MKKKTAGQRWLAKRMKSPTFAAEFKKAREEVDVVDGFIRTLDERRTELGMSKEELARRVSQNPSALRRLLTSGGNPSLKTVMELADAVGLVLKLEVPAKESGVNEAQLEASAKAGGQRVNEGGDQPPSSSSSLQIERGRRRRYSSASARISA